MLPARHHALTISTSDPPTQPSTASPQSVFPSSPPISSIGPNQGVHRRRGSIITEKSLASPSSTFTTSVPRFTVDSERNAASMATLGLDPYADTEPRAIRNQSDDINSCQDQRCPQCDTTYMYNDNREVGPGDPSGVNARAYTRDDSRLHIPMPAGTVYENVPPQPVSPSRLQSLDILRGITIIFMVLVNTQGAEPFVQLAHSEWFGYTLADWVFPNFIFMVGMAVAIVLSPKKLASIAQANSVSGAGITVNTSAPSLSFRKQHPSRVRLNLKIAKRSILLFGIGIALSALEMIGQPAETRWLRIPGVLQRISFCYFILAVAVLWSPVHQKHSNINKNVRAPLDASSTAPPNYLPSKIVQIILPIICTTLWFVLTYAVQSSATEPIPDCAYPTESVSSNGIVLKGNHPSRGQLTPQWCTAQAFLDTVLFQRERDANKPVFDSEGTIGSLMAVVTAWFGWMIGTAVLEQQQIQKSNETKLLQETKELMDKEEEERKLDIRNDIHNKERHGRNEMIGEKYILDIQRRSLLLAHLGQWFMAGVCIMFTGIIMGWFLPICKGLWTPSFTLYSAGISINVLCILIYLYDVPPKPPAPASAAVLVGGVGSKLLQSIGAVPISFGRFCTHLLICYGRNSTLIYVLTELVKIILDRIHVDSKYDWMQTAWSYIFFNSFITFMPPPWASLVFSLVYILIFAPIVWFLNKRRMYLRV
ncbi:hypothetical protein BGX27_011136 [Mortierella sp. AM989]|nr:hypothetical protein BGX27_011136 [Mortierella sp. AM989]